jgi:hypothetical protein|tara:strand:+ start:653 stop:976 length:324 start_codon:yes stop_codon:yes gene_type:complete
MKGFDKIDKFYVSATGEQLSQKINIGYYRQDDTVSIPISPPIRGGDDKFHNGFVEAIKSLTFIYYDKEDEGSTFKLYHDEKTNTFSVKQNGQIATITTKNKENINGK